MWRQLFAGLVDPVSGSLIYLRIIAVSFIIPCFLFFSEPSVHAVHKNAGDLPCGTCHTAHNSQGGMEIGGRSGGSYSLLRAPASDWSEVHNLCLKCHASNGEWANVSFNGYPAPKVYIHGQDGYGNNTKGDDANFSFFYIGAGGDFSRELNWNGTGNATDTQSLGYGHSLGLKGWYVPVPGSNSYVRIVYFSCVTCHDPHGSRFYRYLRYIVAGQVDPRKVYGFYPDVNATGYKSGDGDKSGSNGSSGTTLIWAVAEDTITGDPANDTGKTNVYRSGHSISTWCAMCHPRWHEGVTPSNLDPNGLDWLRHPVVGRLDDGTPLSGAGITILDTSNYTPSVIQQGKALPVVTLDTQNPVYYLTDPSSNDIMCLTCHFAHGGPYYDGLRWDYTSSVATGSQEGKGVFSDRGCQLCHNR